MKIKNLATVLALIACSTSIAFAQQPTQAAETTSNSGVNPMTGRALTEEELMRQLAKQKLQTQIAQELVKQAQSSADLALAAVRQQAEKSRLVAESNPMSQFAPPPAARPSTQRIPASRASAGATSAAILPGSLGPGESFVLPSTPSKPSQAAASGVIRFGGETLSVASMPSTPSVQVQWVDAQIASTESSGRASSTTQVTSMPLTGGRIGIPPIPGLQMPSIDQ